MQKQTSLFPRSSRLFYSSLNFPSSFISLLPPMMDKPKSSLPSPATTTASKVSGVSGGARRTGQRGILRLLLVVSFSILILTWCFQPALVYTRPRQAVSRYWTKHRPSSQAEQQPGASATGSHEDPYTTDTMGWLSSWTRSRATGRAREDASKRQGSWQVQRNSGRNSESSSEKALIPVSPFNMTAGAGTGDDSKVPFEAHIMSMCPDAKNCLQEMVIPVMQHVHSLVDFRYSYIGE
jgi:hypothetical protein